MIAFIADIHGALVEAVGSINDKGLRNCAVFQAGDFGIGFELDNKEIRKLKNMNTLLRKIGVTMYVTRGNHDDPKWFDGRIDLSNLKLLPDYTVVELGLRKVMVVGGAVSVDRMGRTAYIKRNDGHNHVGWWPGEWPVYDEAKIDAAGKVDVIVSHTCPDFCEPLNKNGIMNFLAKDRGLWDDLRLERNIMSKIYDRVSSHRKPDLWVYGHFHINHTMYFQDTKFVALDCDFSMYSHFDNETNTFDV